MKCYKHKVIHEKIFMKLKMPKSKLKQVAYTRVPFLTKIFLEIMFSLTSFKKRSKNKSDQTKPRNL